MSIPPCFADFGKKASQLFTDDFIFGRVKFTAKSTAGNRVEVKTTGISNTDTSKASGSLETKFEHEEYGITVKEKWDTDTILTTDITFNHVPVDGLQLGFDSMFIPTTGQKSGKFKAVFKRPRVHLMSDMEVDYIGAVWRSSAAFSHGPWMAGFQCVYEGSQSRLSANSLGVAYESPDGDYTLAASLLNGSEFMGSLYQQLSPKLEFGVQASCSLTSTATNMTVGARYQVDDDSFFKAKVNNRSHIGLAYGMNVRKDVKLVASAIFDAQNTTQPSHRVGLSLEFE